MKKYVEMNNHALAQLMLDMRKIQNAQADNPELGEVHDDVSKILHELVEVMDGKDMASLVIGLSMFVAMLHAIPDRDGNNSTYDFVGSLSMKYYEMIGQIIADQNKERVVN